MAAFFGFLLAQGWTWSISLSSSDPLYRQATTMSLAAIVLTQVANVLACRSEHLSMFRFGVGSSPLILWGIEDRTDAPHASSLCAIRELVSRHGTAGSGCGSHSPSQPYCCSLQRNVGSASAVLMFSLVKIGSMQVEMRRLRCLMATV